jgi:hypothetical protein
MVQCSIERTIRNPSPSTVGAVTQPATVAQVGR